MYQRTRIGHVKKKSAFRMQIAINYYAGKVENARDNYKVQLHIIFFSNYNINRTA